MRWEREAGEVSFTVVHEEAESQNLHDLLHRFERMEFLSPTSSFLRRLEFSQLPCLLLVWETSLF